MSCNLGAVIICAKEYDAIRISIELKDIDGMPVSLDQNTVIADLKPANSDSYYQMGVDVLDSEQGWVMLTLDSPVLEAGSYTLDLLFNHDEPSRRIASQSINLNIQRAITKPRGV